MGKELITEKSLYEKMGEMHQLVFEILDNIDEKNLNKKPSSGKIDSNIKELKRIKLKFKL